MVVENNYADYSKSKTIFSDNKLHVANSDYYGHNYCATIKSRYLSELFQQHGKTLLFAICIKLDFSVR